MLTGRYDAYIQGRKFNYDRIMEKFVSLKIDYNLDKINIFGLVFRDVRISRIRVIECQRWKSQVSDSQVSQMFDISSISDNSVSQISLDISQISEIYRVSQIPPSNSDITSLTCHCGSVSGHKNPPSATPGRSSGCMPWIWSNSLRMKLLSGNNNSLGHVEQCPWKNLL